MINKTGLQTIANSIWVRATSKLTNKNIIVIVIVIVIVIIIIIIIIIINLTSIFFQDKFKLEQVFGGGMPFLTPTN